MRAQAFVDLLSQPPPKSSMRSTPLNPGCPFCDPSATFRTFETGEIVYVRMPSQYGGKLVEGKVRQYFPHGKHYSVQIGDLVRVVKAERITETPYVRY